MSATNLIDTSFLIIRKNFLLFIILITTISCNQKTASKEKDKVLEETIDKKELYNVNTSSSKSVESDMYCKIELNKENIELGGFELNGSGSTELGLTSSLTVELLEEVHEKYFSKLSLRSLIKSGAPKLQKGTYTIQGSGDPEKLFKNESNFYLLEALDMDSYKKLLNAYGEMDKNDFLKYLSLDLVIIPDGKNLLNIDTIEEIANSKEITKLSDKMSNIKEQLLITGNFQLKLMKISTEEIFTVNSKFKGTYDYDWFNL